MTTERRNRDAAQLTRSPVANANTCSLLPWTGRSSRSKRWQNSTDVVSLSSRNKPNSLTRRLISLNEQNQPRCWRDAPLLLRCFSQSIELQPLPRRFGRPRRRITTKQSVIDNWRQTRWFRPLLFHVRNLNRFLDGFDRKLLNILIQK